MNDHVVEEGYTAAMPEANAEVRKSGSWFRLLRFLIQVNCFQNEGDVIAFKAVDHY
ncbi:hypothetical protein J2X83_001320 [Brevibacillus nitrificans]|nr:hypothetical protein [Brevibacillus nitrificans]